MSRIFDSKIKSKFEELLKWRCRRWGEGGFAINIVVVRPMLVVR
jgi:hypothetical protein